MGKKDADLVHIGKQSWWSGEVRTLCGLRFKPGNHKQENRFFTRTTCPDCKERDKKVGLFW